MCRVVLCTPAAVLPVHYQFKGKDDMTGFSRSQLMQLTIAALPRGSDVMWCVPEDVSMNCLVSTCWPALTVRVYQHDHMHQTAPLATSAA